MMFDDYKRTGFKKILETLDPDLTCDFKKMAFYHNEFKEKKTVKRKKPDQCKEKHTIADPNEDLDNYM